MPSEVNPRTQNVTITMAVPTGIHINIHASWEGGSLHSEWDPVRG